jgi:hypothetical protein
MRALLPGVTLIGLLVAAASPTAAQSPLSYPFCAFDTSSGATSCYYSTREQCGSRCISNPGYIGPQGANASARGATKRRVPRQ